MAANATLRIARTEPGQPERVEVFEVPYEPGASVLDGLIWIRENRDQTLAFRYSCITANVCKECTMRINGKNTFACTARLMPGTTVVEPLRNKLVVRDLVTDTVSPSEQLIRVSQHMTQK